MLKLVSEEPLTHTTGSERTWQRFEKAVTAIQRLYSPDAIVTHNKKLTDGRGRKRQFDVVVEGNVWGSPALAVLECRDKARPIDIGQVEAFIIKASSVGANIRGIVSRAGFTEEAISLAKEHNVGALSLLPEEGSSTPFRVGFQSYVTIYSWPKLRVDLGFKEHEPLSVPWNAEKILCKECSVLNWFKKKLETELKDHPDPGWISVKVVFDDPKSMDIDGQLRSVTEIVFHALRQREVRTKFVPITGDMFYDWQTMSWSLPSGGSLYTGTFSPDFSDWEAFEGEVPQQVGPISMNMIVYRKTIGPETEVLDLLAV